MGGVISNFLKNIYEVFISCYVKYAKNTTERIVADYFTFKLISWSF